MCRFDSRGDLGNVVNRFKRRGEIPCKGGPRFFVPSLERSLSQPVRDDSEGTEVARTVNRGSAPAVSNKQASSLVPPMAYIARNQLKATVLVVDDSPEIQRYLRVLLELDSHHVETANSGHEALQSLCRGCAPDVVLLDLQMPGMDGLETLRRLRQLRPNAKVIMCSGMDDPEKIREAASLGAHAYLVKPVQHLYLSAAVERCLTEGPAKRATEHLGNQLFVLPSPSPL